MLLRVKRLQMRRRVGHTGACRREWTTALRRKGTRMSLDALCAWTWRGSRWSCPVGTSSASGAVTGICVLIFNSVVAAIFAHGKEIYSGHRPPPPKKKHISSSVHIHRNAVPTSRNEVALADDITQVNGRRGNLSGR